MKRGEIYPGTKIRFLKDVGNTGAPRYRKMILGQCMNCDTIKLFRHDHLVPPRIKTCGCYIENVVKKGKLTELSVWARKDRIGIRNGGKAFNNGIVVYVSKSHIERFKNVTLGDLLAFDDE